MYVFFAVVLTTLVGTCVVLCDEICIINAVVGVFFVVVMTLVETRAVRRSYALPGIFVVICVVLRMYDVVVSIGE